MLLQILVMLIRSADIALGDRDCRWLPGFPRMGEGQFDLTSTALAVEVLAEFDCALVAANHDAVDFTQITKHSALVIDRRRVCRDDGANIVKERLKNYR